jgi:splicing factor 3B subunit 3
MQVQEVAQAPLPGNPNAVWTVKGRQEDSQDRYIVVSFSNATLVFQIGEQIEEVTDSGFLGTAPTLQVRRTPRRKRRSNNNARRNGRWWVSRVID